MEKRRLERNQIAVYAAAVAFAVGIAFDRPDAAGVLERLIDPVLAVLLYVTFLEIPFVRLRRAFTNGRFVAAALGVNFLVVPVVAWGLTRALPRERTDGDGRSHARRAGVAPPRRFDPDVRTLLTDGGPTS